MYFKCTNCQKSHEPPLPPAQSSILSHCPDCGSPVTMIVHDTERPPPHEPELDPFAPPAGAVEEPSDYCAECGGSVWRSETGYLIRADHDPDCSRNPNPPPPASLSVVE